MCVRVWAWVGGCVIKVSSEYLQEKEDGGVHVVLAVRVAPLVRGHHLSMLYSISSGIIVVLIGLLIILRIILKSKKSSVIAVGQCNTSSFNTYCTSFRATL